MRMEGGNFVKSIVVEMVDELEREFVDSIDLEEVSVANRKLVDFVIRGEEVIVTETETVRKRCSVYEGEDAIKHPFMTDRNSDER
jgi:tryptophan synthase beta subunit